jgi:hypothetical protein
MSFVLLLWYQEMPGFHDVGMIVRWEGCETHFCGVALSRLPERGSSPAPLASAATIQGTYFHETFPYFAVVKQNVKSKIISSSVIEYHRIPPKHPKNLLVYITHSRRKTQHSTLVTFYSCIHGLCTLQDPADCQK